MTADSERSLPFSQEVALVTDRDTGRPRGFGFVTMDDEGAKAANPTLDRKQFECRNLTVNEAKPRENRGGGGGGRRDKW